MGNNNEIRTLIAPIDRSSIILPGSVVAEVIEYSELQPFKNAPDWLLGELEWSGWKIPVVNFALLAGTSDETGIPARARILVVKTLSLATSINFVGIIITGLPRLKNVTTGSLVETGTEAGTGVFSQVTIDEKETLVPDLDSLSEAIEKAAYPSG